MRLDNQPEIPRGFRPSGQGCEARATGVVRQEIVRRRAVVWGGVMRFYPQLMCKYDLSWPGNAPFARKLRFGGVTLVIIGIAMVVLSVLGLFDL